MYVYFYRLRKSSSPSNWWSKGSGVPPPRLPRAPRPTPRARSLDRPRLSPFTSRSALPIPGPPTLHTPPHSANISDNTEKTVDSIFKELPRLSPNQPKARSYDDLLDKSDKSAMSSSENLEPSSDCSPERDPCPAMGHLTQSCEDVLDCLEEEEPSELTETPRRAQSCEGLLQGPPNPHQVSMLSLPLPLDNTNGGKRKKNFMDKCVNKVRSLVLRK